MLNEMATMKPCSLEYKALEPREIINKKRLVHSAENVIEQKYNKQFGLSIEKDTWLGRTGKVINYEKALAFSLSPIPLNIANADGSRRKWKKSKLKDFVIETANWRKLVRA